jgi:hypothetical protein
LTEASSIFQRLADAEAADPLHLSYHGLLTATVGRNPREGRRICELAVTLTACEPQILFNLVRTLEVAGDTARAVEVLRTGIRQNPGDKRLLKEINRLSPRRRPPLSMVHRDQFLNKRLAILLAGLSNRPGKKQKTAFSKKAVSPVLGTLRTVRQT